MLHRLLAVAHGAGGFVTNMTAFSGALVTRSTDKTITDNTFTEIDWDTEVYDTDNYWSSSPNTDLIIPAAGYYIAGAVIRWKATNNATAGARNVAIHPNGEDPATLQAYAELEWPNISPAGALVHMSLIMPPRHFTATEFLRCAVYHYSGGSSSLDVDANGSRTPAFWIMRVGLD